MWFPHEWAWGISWWFIRFFTKHRGNHRFPFRVWCDCMMLLCKLHGKIAWNMTRWLLTHDWMIVRTWHDDMKWTLLVISWISMLGKFWESSGLAVILPDFHQNCGLRNIYYMATCALSFNLMHLKCKTSYQVLC